MIVLEFELCLEERHKQKGLIIVILINFKIRKISVSFIPLHYNPEDADFNTFLG